MKNKQPTIINANPNAGGMFAGIKPALQEGARSAFMQSKARPQLILIILPVCLYTFPVVCIGDSPLGEFFW